VLAIAMIIAMAFMRDAMSSISATSGTSSRSADRRGRV
jgi:hypothetical protein